jgi:hypothetical protein
MARFVSEADIPNSHIVLIFSKADINNSICKGSPGEVHNPAWQQGAENNGISPTLPFTKAATSTAEAVAYMQQHDDAQITGGVTMEQYERMAALPGKRQDGGGDCGVGHYEAYGDAPSIRFEPNQS